MGRLNRPADPGTAQPETPEAVLAGLQRRSQLVLAAAFVMAVGAVIAFALHARPVGIVLLVLMLVGGMASFWFSVQFRNRAVAEARVARQAQAARAAAGSKGKPTRPRP